MTTKSKTTARKPYRLTATIRLLSKDNPHRKTSGDFGKFRELATGMTVEKALAAGVDRGYLRYAAERQILSVR
jgi:hypothetical protein